MEWIIALGTLFVGVALCRYFIAVAQLLDEAERDINGWNETDD